MYDDLLGKRKSKEEDVIGICSQCVYTKITSRNLDVIFCGKIKKHVHASQYGCLKFRRKALVGKILY
jgi:hypothetical protein